MQSLQETEVTSPPIYEIWKFVPNNICNDQIRHQIPQKLKESYFLSSVFTLGAGVNVSCVHGSGVL